MRILARSLKESQQCSLASVSVILELYHVVFNSSSNVSNVSLKIGSLRSLLARSSLIVDIKLVYPFLLLAIFLNVLASEACRLVVAVAFDPFFRTLFA